MGPSCGLTFLICAQTKYEYTDTLINTQAAHEPSKRGAEANRIYPSEMLSLSNKEKSFESRLSKIVKNSRLYEKKEREEFDARLS